MNLHVYRPGRNDVIAASLCALVGLALSVLPHLVWWSRIGEPVWIADEDDLLYLSVAGQAYFNHPFALADPTRAEGGAIMYPWSEFGPAIVLARWLNLSPLRINLIWRIWAGLSIGLGWYLVLRYFFRSPWFAAALSVILLADIGLIAGRPLVNHFWYFTELVTGRSDKLMMSAPSLGYVPILSGIPGVCPQWRIITPGLSLAFLLLDLWLLARARAQPSWGRIVGAGAGFGLLIHTYFYYWTAAGLALLLGLLIDPERRKVYFHAGWIGGLIGLPAILANARVKHAYPADWLERSDHFVPIDRFSHLLFPKVALGLLMLTGLWILWSRRKDLIPFWTLAAAGLILTDHQVLSGLQIQNMHWQWYVAGPLLSLLVVILAAGWVAGRAPWPRPLVVAFGLFCAIHLGIGFYLRAVEATQNRLCTAIMDDYRRYRDQRLKPGAKPLAANAVVAGDQGFVNLAAILENQRPLLHYAALFSPSTTNEEWYLRMALNGYLSGQDRSLFEAQERRHLADAVWGPWSRDPSARARSLADRLAAYDRVAADPPAAIRQFAVRYVALPAGQPRPSQLGKEWNRFEQGTGWTLWEYRGPR